VSMEVLADSTNRFYIPPHLLDGGHQHGGLRLAVSMDSGDDGQSHEHRAHRKRCQGERRVHMGTWKQGTG
jgi:hypothetical protein